MIEYFTKEFRSIRETREGGDIYISMSQLRIFLLNSYLVLVLLKKLSEELTVLSDKVL